MTREIAAPIPASTVMGIGPYAVPLPYAAGSISAVVILDGVRTVLTASQFSLVPAASETAGNLFLSPAAATAFAGGRLYISRDTSVQQGWAGVLGERERGLEAQLDVLTMAVQDLRRTADRSIRLDQATMPVAIQPGGTLRFDTSGRPYVATMDEATAVVQIDPLRARDAAELLADTQRSYSAGLRVVAPGQIIVTQAEGFSYQVAAESAVDHHLQTAGGIRLYVLPDAADMFWVDAFGAVGDGATDDTAVFQKAITATPSVGGTLVLSARNYKVTPMALVAGARKLLWLGNSRINDQVYRALPGRSEIYDAENGRLALYQHAGQPGDWTTYDMYRRADYTGGAAGEVDTLLRAYTYVGATAGQAGQIRAEWALQGRVDNYSPNINAVGVTGQARRFDNGAIWAGHFNAIDNTATTGTKATRAIEANIQANGTDPNNLRWILDVVAHNVAQVTGAAGADQITYGAFVRAGTANLKTGIKIADGTGAEGGKILSEAIRIETDAVAMRAYGLTREATLQIGAKIASGVLGQIDFVGNNAGGAQTNYGFVRASVIAATTGAESGRLSLIAINAGTETALMTLEGGQADAVSIWSNGALKRVVAGAADSGGAGFRLLRVAN